VRALQDCGWDDTLPGLRGALADTATVFALSRLPEVDSGDRIAVGAAVITAIMSPTDRSEVLRHRVIRGRDIVAAAGGRRPGPWVGELVAEALDRQYRGEFTDKSGAPRGCAGRCRAPEPRPIRRNPPSWVTVSRMDEDKIIPATTVCSTCGAQRGDHSGGSFNCPNSPAIEANQFRFRETAFAL